MGRDREKLFYMYLPKLGRPYLAEFVVPAVGLAAGGDFRHAREILYLKVIGRELVYALPMQTNPPGDMFDESADDNSVDQVGLLASKLTDYVAANKGGLKVVALYHEPESVEEDFLKKAVALVNDRCHQQSGDNLKPIVLEKLVA